VTDALRESLFELDAQRYDAAYDASGAPGHALRDRLATVLELAGRGPGEAIDAGMGPGRLVAELERRGWHVSGVDASAAMVALAQARVPEARDRLVRAPIESLPFADASFELAVATGVLEYADDLEAALRELTRVLRPGGRAIVSLPNWWSASAFLRRKALYPLARRAGRATPPSPRRLVRASELDRLLRDAGLRPTGVHLTSFRPRRIRRSVFAAQLVFETER
jgi:SAM-dependent methyltransferase